MHVGLSPSLSQAHKDIYNFFRIHMSKAAVNDAAEPFIKLVDAWLVYLTPWTASAKYVDDVRVSTTGGFSTAAFDASDYKSTWERFVIANYLVCSIVCMCHECVVIRVLCAGAGVLACVDAVF